MTIRFVGVVLLTATAFAAGAEEQPKTYALVAAVGDTIEYVHEVQSTGTHIPPYRRQSEEVGNVLNRLVLGSLDRAVAGLDASSDRIYLAVRPSAVAKGSPSERGKAALAAVVAELDKIPQRTQWHRIVVATPAYESLARGRMASRLQGVGVFTQPLCQSNPASCEQGFRPGTGPEAETPGGERIRANAFVAPYAYLDIWVLDPKSLAVLDHQTSLESRKLADDYGGIDLADDRAREFVVSRFVAVVQDAVRDAVHATELRGTVEVGPVKPVE